MKALLHIFLLAAAVIPAQARHDGVMTLRDCMEYAVSNSTKVRIQQATVGDARIARRDAILSVFLPTLSGGSSASYSFGRNIDPETNTYINTVSFSNGYNVSAGITLFNGFSAVNNLKISQTALKMGETREKQIEAELCLAVMEAFYNVVYYKRLLDVYEEQVATSELSLTKARRQEELGQKGHADVVQMEADLADRQYELTNVRNMYLDQKMTLEDLMFWPSGEELVIDTRMPDQVGHDGAPVIPGLTTVTPGLTGGPVEDEVVTFALAHNPGVQIADWTRLNARRELNTARWQVLPSVSLSGGWSTNYYSFQGSQQTPYWDLLRRNGGEYVSMSVSVPIFNRLSRQSNIARRRNALAPRSGGGGAPRGPGPGRCRHGVQPGAAQGRGTGGSLHAEPEEIGAGAHLPAGVPDGRQQLPQGPGRRDGQPLQVPHQTGCGKIL